jgi:hypothetical protein
MNAFFYIVGLFYQARSRRAYKRAIALKASAEKFFARIGL